MKREKWGATASAEEGKRVLHARAQVLARVPEARRAAEESIQIVEFLLAHETYALEAAYLREVYPLKEFAPLPGAPPFVLGILNVRGKILSVIDLKKFFDLPAKGLTDLNKVLIIHDARMEFGILADAVLGARALPLAALQPALPTLTGIRAEYLRGVTGQGLVLLDAARLLADPNIIVREQVETS